jgi:lipoprotein Spr
MKAKLLSIVFALTATISSFAGTQSLESLQGVAERYNVELSKVIEYYTTKNIDILDVENIDLFFVTFKWLKTPYRFGGNSKYGIDCSHFTQMVHQEAFNSGLTGNSREQFNQSVEVSRDELQEGDLIFFRINSSHITHVGIYMGNNKFAQSTCSKGVIVSDLDEEYWSRYFYKCARYTPNELDQDLVEQESN